MSNKLPRFTPPGERNDFATERRRMIREQLAAPGRDIANPRVLAALEKVPRHEFIPEAQRALAYQNRALPIGQDQTISQPYIVALMTERLDPQPTDRVLEIGTGSGYQAAVLAELVREVFTIEIVDSLARRAEADLKRLGYSNVFVRWGDGHGGWPEAAPFDVIIVTCAPEKVPSPLIAQLKDGGRIVAPLGKSGPLFEQELILLRKRGNEVERQFVMPVRFVPMTGEGQR